MTFLDFLYKNDLTLTIEPTKASAYRFRVILMDKDYNEVLVQLTNHPLLTVVHFMQTFS